MLLYLRRYWCGDGYVSPDDCPPGHYCPLRTGYNQPTCPAGTYSASLRLGNITECLICPPAEYCTDPGSLTPDGFCWAGYWCAAGAMLPTGVTGPEIFWAPTAGGDCPVGHYCPNATFDPFECEPGTYRDATLGKAPEDCACCPAVWMLRYYYCLILLLL